MRRIGLTGGIAAGKSTVSQRLLHLGATVIDHDKLAREVVAPGTPGLESITLRFGGDVLTNDGELDRPALAAIVFNDPDALTDLNAIVHPLVLDLAAQLESRAARAGAAVVVHDIPLLIETGQRADFDQLLVVCAPADLRISRLVEGRGLSLPEARRRIASQVDDEVREAAADVVFDGSGSVEHLQEQVDSWWRTLNL
ncbi:dephospho-CoA kinase [Rarobacter incanus]|uniref:Dephospho-CoA kinase n=1 Tax=Rarobacter incanus TaxID=153494 RepID=A0A542SMA2_9MICO|nr:dephospho-CoA kinase [Rarobacter incanus]TQK75754.1 dephospho-CoA kinase [Rarobacter incanus]